MSAHEDQLARRVAACACGALWVTTIGTPAIVNACACLDCQRRCGSAFIYTAFFPDAQRFQIPTQGCGDRTLLGYLAEKYSHKGLLPGRMRRRASPKLLLQFRRNKIPPVAPGECRTIWVGIFSFVPP